MELLGPLEGIQRENQAPGTKRMRTSCSGCCLVLLFDTRPSHGPLILLEDQLQLCAPWVPCSSPRDCRHLQLCKAQLRGHE